MTPDSASDSILQESVRMARALELAARGLYTTDPNPRVGCVLVRDGEVVGEGWHARAGEPHAEVMALRAAAGRARGAVAYVTLEPCCHTGRTPPCADALIAAGITHVVCATVDPNPKVAGGGIKRLEAAGIEVTVGVLAERAHALNIGFFSRFERGRPFIRLKLAMSLDARTAPSEGEKAWITDEASRADVQVWRARSSAILTGAGTIRVDDPRLDVRLDYGPWVRQPLRVVLDTDLTCPPASKVFHDGHALIFAASDAPERSDTPEGSGAPERGGIPERSGMSLRTERVPRAPRGLDLEAVLARLVLLEVNELLVECGPRLAAAFLEANLVDELILYVAPHFLGMDAPPLAALAGLASVRRLSRFEFHDQRLIDNDLRLILTPKRA
jgi:diaminohydroxyphosphoribosylaminopyrimidine deaminase/5-amino-6-(5-phosphoribosylamino)uracil reductase